MRILIIVAKMMSDGHFYRLDMMSGTLKGNECYFVATHAPQNEPDLSNSTEKERERPGLSYWEGNTSITVGHS